MKFFTPELYIRYNSPDDVEADRADEEWEKRLNDYKNHLSRFSNEMNPRVRDLAETICLHDAELLSFQEDLPGQLSPPFFQFSFSVATIALRSDRRIVNLIYLLWDEVGQDRPAEDWPFSRLRTHWLYDEIDVERRQPYPPLFWHRVLLSDGRVISIPFFDVVIQAFSEQNPETAVVTKRRA